MANEKLTHIAFGLILHPSRRGWPKHGCFVIRTGKDTTTTRDMFSVQACREVIKSAVEKGGLDGDRASDLERTVTGSGLPTELTRYDRLARACSCSEDYERLINRFCGQTPPENGSDTARFRRCVIGQYCGLENCAAYPAHVMLYPDGINAGCGDIAFSRQGAEDRLATAVESGILLPEEADSCRKDLTFLSVTPTAEQADRFTTNMPRKGWHDHLDVVFGLRRPEKPARFARCGEDCSRIHFYPYDDRELGVGAHSRFDATHLVDDAVRLGLVAQEDEQRLRASIPELDLPVGCKEESIYFNPLSAVTMSLENLLGMFKQMSRGLD